MGARVVVSRVGPPAGLTAILIGAWEAWIRIGDIDPTVAPAPSQVAIALFDKAGSLGRESLTTLGETAIGLAIGALLGIAIALSIATWPLARRATEPLLVVLQTIPPIVLTPILVLAFGFGWTPRIVVVSLIVFFPVTIAAAGGLTAADPARLELVRSFGATHWQAFRMVAIPGALPAIFDGLRISAAYAVAGAAIAEQIGGARGGLGLFIARSQRNTRSDQVVAGVVVIALLSLVVYALVAFAARRAMPWHPESRLEAR